MNRDENEDRLMREIRKDMLRMETESSAPVIGTTFAFLFALILIIYFFMCPL